MHIVLFYNVFVIFLLFVLLFDLYFLFDFYCFIVLICIIKSNSNGVVVSSQLLFLAPSLD